MQLKKKSKIVKSLFRLFQYIHILTDGLVNKIPRNTYKGDEKAISFGSLLNSEPVFS